MKKFTVCISTMIALSSILAACSSQTDQKDTSANNRNESSSGGGKITINLMHRYHDANVGKHPEDTAVLSMLKKFKNDHPDIEVVEEQLQSGDYDVKAQALAAAGNLPDVFLVPGAWMTNFVNNEVVSPLNDDLDKIKKWKDGYRPGTFEAGTRNGKIYGVPIAAGPVNLIYYNSKLLAEAGYNEFPATWDKFIDLNEKLKARGVTPMSFGNKNKSYAMYAWLNILTDRIVGTEWTESIIKGNGAAFTDPGFIQAASLIEEMLKKGYFNKDLNTIDPNTMVTYYFQGKSAMYAEGIWSAQNIVNNAPKDLLEVTKVTTFPVVAGGKGNPKSAAGGAGVYYSINSKVEPGPKRDAILKLLEYMTGEESAKLMAGAGGFPAYNPGDFDRSKLHRVAVEAYEASNAAPASKIFDLWFDASVVVAINTKMQEVLAGSKTPEQMAKEVQSAYDTYLKNRVK
ncbi:MAG: hypothetical protein K0S39_6076 [Paenibacillus sp.]|jgi:raffinose/stachyose/melibiose transport system substrate-binding protein|nr:hypothetical protein [Paenibacillus sp.]